MATIVGPRYPTTAVDGGGPVAWSNVNNVKANDGSVTTASNFVVSGSGVNSNQLTVTNFGFSIPTGATIRGIYVEVNVVSYNNTADFNAYLVKSGSNVSPNYSNQDDSMTTTFGGPTDLWGGTWTPADINDSTFGFSNGYTYTTGPADANVSIDSMRITIYYDLVVVSSYNPSIQKKAYAKVYQTGSYLGLIPNIVTDFEFVDEINTAASQTTIVSAMAGDNSFLGTTSPLLTEDSVEITDESGVTLFTEASTNNFSVGGNNSLIANGNTIVVYEINGYNPNGIVIFRGTITKWTENLLESKISIYIDSDGLDLDNTPLIGPPFNYTVDQQQTTNNSQGTIQSFKGSYMQYGQSFKTGSGTTNIGGIYLMLSHSVNTRADVTVNLYSNSAATTKLASVTRSVTLTSTMTENLFSFNPRSAVSVSTSYFFDVSVNDGQEVYIGINSSNGYTDGSLYYSSYDGSTGTGSPYSADTSKDLYFKTASSNGVTTVSYPSQDPVTGMFAAAMLEYKNQGGKLDYQSSDVQAAGYSVPYIFTVATMFEAIDKFKELAPANWYWYVDRGTNLITLKQSSAVPDFTFVKGKHIKDLEVTPTTEYVKNIVYFTGGKIGEDNSNPSYPVDINLYKVYTDVDSINRYGKRISRMSDPQVTSVSAANALALSEIQEYRSEKYMATVTVLDSKVDITQLKPGKTVGFRGFGNYKDNLVLQITRRQYSPRSATLELGVIPQRQQDDIEQITRGLLTQQTINNPNQPS